MEINNKEENTKHWYYKDTGWLGAYIIETDGGVTKQTDVTHVKGYIEDLLQENKQLKERVEYLERSNNRREDTITELRSELYSLESECTDDRIYYDGEAYTIEKILNNIEKCDSVHDNCDCLLDHDECYYLINYIKQLNSKNEQLKAELEAMKELEDVTEDNIPWLRGEDEDE